MTRRIKTDPEPDFDNLVVAEALTMYLRYWQDKMAESEIKRDYESYRKAQARVRVAEGLRPQYEPRL